MKPKGGIGIPIRICSIVLALLLLLAAPGCSERESETDDSQSSQGASQDQASELDIAQSAPVEDATESGEAAEDEPEPEPAVIRLTIPEGYTLARIGMLLEEKGVCTADEFIEASQTGDFSEFPLVAMQEENPNRCFRLEGYLFPDTYEIYADDPPDRIIRRILDHTEQMFDPALRDEIAASGYTVDEVLTIASIIEKEAFGDEQMPLISSVLHNRLNIQMRIQCDVTITYVKGAIMPFISGDKDRYNDYYNTYTCPALPAGAICNPSITAVRAALRPADTDYLFFVTDKDQNYYYNADYEEHLRVIDEIGLFAEDE